MRVLLACSLGGAGHLTPLLPWADAAARRGDDVLVVVPPSLESSARASGHPVRVGAEPPDDEVAGMRDRLVEAPPAEAVVVGDRELFGRLATAAMLPAMEDTFYEWVPDLILREPCEYASAVVGAQSSLPFATVAIGMADIEASVASLVAPVLDPYVPGLTDRILAAPYLTRFPASIDPSAWADTRRFSEPLPRPGEPLPDWWGRSEAPLVYVTLGSVAGGTAIAVDAYRAALDATSPLDVRVLLTVGRRTDVSALGPIPPNVHVEAWVPQADVLGHADLVVSHGGSGTTFGALAAGLPVVVYPLFADQWTNGQRIATSGAGLTVEPPGGRPRRAVRPDDAGEIRQAVETVLAGPGYRERARSIAAEMAGAPGIDARLALLAISPSEPSPGELKSVG